MLRISRLQAVDVSAAIFLSVCHLCISEVYLELDRFPKNLLFKALGCDFKPPQISVNNG